MGDVMGDVIGGILVVGLLFAIAYGASSFTDRLEERDCLERRGADALYERPHGCMVKTESGYVPEKFYGAE